MATNSPGKKETTEDSFFNLAVDDSKRWMKRQIGVPMPALSSQGTRRQPDPNLPPPPVDETSTGEYLIQRPAAETPLGSARLA